MTVSNMMTLLPTEILRALCSRMGFTDLHRFSSTNRYIHTATKSAFLAKQNAEIETILQSLRKAVAAENPLHVDYVVPVTIRPHPLLETVRFRVGSGSISVSGPTLINWIKVAKLIAAFEGVLVVTVEMAAFLYMVKSRLDKLYIKKLTPVGGKAPFRHL